MLIRLNMATSLDGKIASAERLKTRLGSDADYKRLDELRAWADVLVAGAGTIRAEDPPMELKDQQSVSERREAGRSEHPAVAVITGSFDLPVGRTFQTPGRKIIVTSEEADDPPAELASVAEIWRIGSKKVDVPALVAEFEKEGLDNILLEGGGETAAGFFEHDLVDELFITVTRWVLGDDRAPTIADDESEFDHYNQYELLKIKPTEEEVFLHYRRREETR